MQVRLTSASTTAGQTASAAPPTTPPRNIALSPQRRVIVGANGPEARFVSPLDKRQHNRRTDRLRNTSTRLPPLQIYGCSRTPRRRTLDAIDAVLKGARAADVESEIVDFKEERGTFDPSNLSRGPIAPHHEAAARALTEEVGCLANSDSGGVLIVGVADDHAGPAAFVGTYLDIAWLRERIYALTQPSISVDLIEEAARDASRIF